MRISKVTTRTGDKGRTHLADGSSVEKNSRVICLIGDVDELNANVGMLVVMANRFNLKTEEQKTLKSIQNVLFDFGAELATSRSDLMSQQQVAFLEQKINLLNAALPPLKEFVLPGTDELNAWCHICRVVCRRLERAYVAFQGQPSYNSFALQYLNRLSDYFFVLARTCSKDANENEQQWNDEQSDF